MVPGQMPATDRDHISGEPLPTISDEFMADRLGGARPYTVVLLRKTPQFKRPDVDAIVWEHGRRNMALVEHGVLAIVLPANQDPGDWAGLGIFSGPPEDVKAIMDHDPGVEAGIFTYEIHPVRGFPGAALPG